MGEKLWAGQTPPPHLEDEYSEVVPAEKVSMVGLQLLNLDGLLLHTVPDLLHVDADLAALVQQFAEGVCSAAVAFAQFGDVVLDSKNGTLYLRLALLQTVLVLLDAVQHLHQLVQQCQNRDSTHTFRFRLG